MRRTAVAILLALSAPALAQDVPGLELCTAEKQMDRRTGCLQSNDDYLQQQMLKHVREMQAKLTASSRELAASKAEITALKSKVDSLSGELAALKAKVDTGTRR
jgi:hypothetical protein